MTYEGSLLLFPWAMTYAAVILSSFLASLCVLDESILAFALESQTENAGTSDPPPKPRQPFPPALALMPPNSITTSNPLRPREPEAPLSYAGVLRTPPKTVETDPIQKIRNLGAVGSQVL